MKVLSTEGLTKLIQLIKSAFISVDDTTQATELSTETVSELTLSTVATSGDYNDLTNKPTIPTVNNATLTIQKNGTTVKTFTANASSNVTCNITVPTKTSDITNDSGYITGISSSDVTTALGYTPENVSNKTTAISSNSTDTQYPSAKSVVELLKTIYPVGSVYLSTNATCPMASLFGTWTLVSSGKALWTGDGTNGNTTIAQSLPDITGVFSPLTRRTDTTFTASGCFTGSVAGSASKKAGENGTTLTNDSQLKFNASNSNSIYSGSTVQPPAYVVNVWRRTA